MLKGRLYELNFKLFHCNILIIKTMQYVTVTRASPNYKLSKEFFSITLIKFFFHWIGFCLLIEDMKIPK